MKKILLFILIIVSVFGYSQNNISYLSNEFGKIEFEVSESLIYIQTNSKDFFSDYTITDFGNNFVVIEISRENYDDELKKLKSLYDNVEPVLIYDNEYKQICFDEIIVKTIGKNELDDIFKDLDFKAEENEYEKNEFLVRHQEIIESLSIIRQALDKMPEEGGFHADVPEYYLPPKDEVYNNMEALIYHFKIVMGEIPVPVGEVYHAVEGGNGELGFYLITDGSRTPYRLHFRRPCFIYYQAYTEIIRNSLFSDALITLASLNVIAGELDA